MVRAWILTSWVSDINPDTGMPRNVPAIFSDFAFVPDSGERWRDVTGQPNANIPSSPNLLVVEVYVLDQTLDDIRANINYGDSAILAVGDLDNSPVVTEPQYTLVCQWLANKFSATVQQVKNVLGATSNGRTRMDIAMALRDYLRNRPHA